MTHDLTHTLQAFSLTSTLAVLQPGSVLQLAPFSERGRVCSDWIIDIRTFTDSASLHGSHWERHLHGDEMLTVLQGGINVVLDTSGEEKCFRLGSGDSLVVPRGCWHRLEVLQPGQLLFVTTATGSEHSPRNTNS